MSLKNDIRTVLRLRQRPLTAPELADALEQPSPRIRAALDEMRKAGLIRLAEIPGRAALAYANAEWSYAPPRPKYGAIKAAIIGLLAEQGDMTAKQISDALPPDLLYDAERTRALLNTMVNNGEVKRAALSYPRRYRLATPPRDRYIGLDRQSA